MPALWDETRAGGNPWKMRLATAFPRAAADTGLLRAERELRDEGWELAGGTFTRDGQRMLPVYEPPMIDLFDHGVAQPRYWIAEHGPVAVQRKGETVERPGVADRLAELGWNWEWLCAWRAPVQDRASRRGVPAARGDAADSLPLMLPRVVPPFAAALIAAQSSLVFEYVARQKIDGPVVRAAHWKQLPVPTPGMLEPHLPFIVPRVLELVYTSSDMSPLARDLDDRGEDPFAWDADRRASLRAELDAFFFRCTGSTTATTWSTSPTRSRQVPTASNGARARATTAGAPGNWSWPPTTAWPKPTPPEPSTKPGSSRLPATDPGTGQTPLAVHGEAHVEDGARVRRTLQRYPAAECLDPVLESKQS